MNAMTLWTLCWLLLGVLLGHLVGCGPTPSPPAGGDCAAACQRLRNLDCPEAKPTKAGAQCEAWMCKYESSPAGVNADCVAHVASCDAVARCGR